MSAQTRTHGNRGKTASAASTKDAKHSIATNPDSLSCNRKAGRDSRRLPIKNLLEPNNLLGLGVGSRSGATLMERKAAPMLKRDRFGRRLTLPGTPRTSLHS